jgi:HD superfamily phosphohydrolase
MGASVAKEAMDWALSSYSLYEEYRTETGTEPAWTQDQPIRAQKELRLTYALREDTFANMPAFPHTGLSYRVKEGGLCEDLSQVYNLHRLSRIKQLGFLQAPWFKDSLYANPIADHNRFMHSLDVMAMATVIGANLKLDRRQMNTLRMAAFTHDMGTPAGGDSVMLVDPEAFDEDLHYPEFLNRPGWKRIRDTYAIDRRMLIRTILNQGLLGQILDIADKLAYTARDLHCCLPYLEYGRKHMDQYTLEELFRLVELHPQVCGIWDSITIDNRRMAFKDAERLGVFLKVRALMFREVYYHANARFGEYLVARVLVKALYKSGKITRAELLTMGDEELSARLDHEYGTDRNRTTSSLVEDIVQGGGAKRRTFATSAEAEVFLASLRAEGNPFSLLEDIVKTIKVRGDFLVLTVHGPKPYSVVCPDAYQELEEMVRPFQQVHVYYLEREPLIPRQKLAEIFAAAHGE